jgi:Arc/MetJ-type ribon-helix-helix transcriptional regulator
MMQVTLNNPEMVAFIDEQVRAGRYASPEHAVETLLGQAMRADAPFDADDDFTDDELAEIRQIEAEYESGKSRPFAEFAAEVRLRLREGRL